MQVLPFKVHFTDGQLSRLQEQLRAAHIARPTYEASSASAGHGVKRDWLVAAKKHWENGFDWRAQEARINELSHYTALVPQETGHPFKLHFIHERANKPNARTVLFIHGWPGSFLEFIDIVKILQKRGDLNIVVASSPGYAFSDPPPLNRAFYDEDVAVLLNCLMLGLGYDRYVVQAGDWGQTVARLMSIRFPAVCGAHLNFMPFGRAPDGLLEADYSEADKKGLARGQEFLDYGRGYSAMHRERTSTISFVVSSSPVALLAWGGHFAALEKPEVLAADLREFLDLVWK
ncbi:hypothetical protein P7C70_g4771, partial [Phenoliferia sp. Uapishka_3]